MDHQIDFFDDGQILFLLYKWPMTQKGFYPKYEYVYDEYNDWVICPNHQTLYGTTTNREDYRIYKSIPFNCERCPDEKRQHYTESKAFEKMVIRYIKMNDLEKAEEVGHSQIGKTSIYASELNRSSCFCRC